MADHAKISLLSPSFFIIFMPKFHGNGTLQFPKHFVEEHWESLSKQACLGIPTGEKYEMKMKMRNGKAWLYKGWQEFVQKYSIKYGYLLLFTHQERSNFTVQIFDLSTEEIKYPSTSCQEEVNFVIKEEGCDTEDCPTELDKDREINNHSNAEILQTGESSLSIENLSVDLLQREKAVRTRNPHFSVTMKSAHVTYSSKTSYLHIPKYARPYFHNKGKDDIYLSLEGGIGKVWSLKYYVGNASNDITRINSGWKDFSEENSIKEGDACTFELLSTTDMIFKVTISRKTDEIVSKRGTKRKSALPVTDNSTAIECSETSFAATIRKAQVQQGCRLNIPRAHSRRHILDQHGKEVLLHRFGGKTWRIKCNVNGFDVRFLQGWKDFVVGNDLQVGDTCVFELFPENPNHYKVAIFSGAGSSG